MIKLSSLLEYILDHPMKGEAIQEAKRLERIDECGQLTHLEITPDVSNTELKPLVDEDGYKVYIIVDERGCCADWHFTGRDADLDARNRTEDTGQPHTVCQVMAPVDGECPTIPVATFTPTPEREHEWVIFNPDFVHDGVCWAEQDKYGEIFWNNVPYDADTIRFSSAVKAQAYITTHNITNAFPWAIPKLSEK